MLLIASLSVLAVVVALTLSLSPNSARGEEAEAGAGSPATTQEAPSEPAPTPQQTMEALEAASTRDTVEAAQTDPKVAEELPHRDLDQGEALELAEGVFGAALEEPAGIFDELEPERFLSDNAAIVTALSPPDPDAAGPGDGSGAEGGSAVYRPEEDGPPDPVEAGQSVLLESSLPLRTEDEDGQEEAVDLHLQSAEGSDGGLQPQNPLTEVAIPAHLEEGISLEGGVQIEVEETVGDTAPTNVEERYAFYPNVAENTDLIVTPTPTGVETLTDVRSAEAPDSTTYRLSLPDGATLQAAPDGGAEVMREGSEIVVVPPPSATDAAGEPVPVEMRVDGDKLTVTISPSGSTAYPVLVDPNYIVESWCWNGCFKYPYGRAWSPTSNSLSYRALPNSYWESGHLGLDLTSGYTQQAAPSGTQADWAYWVPRYRADYEKYGTRPSTFIAFWMAEGVLFLTHGNNANYPVMSIGLIELGGAGWAPGTWHHYGSEGDLSNWGNVLVNNPGSNPAIKGADENLITYENESTAKRRDTFIGSSAIEVVDVDAPQILGLKAPGWVTGPSASIGYTFEDAGLGVRSAGVRRPGETTSPAGWTADFGCVGDAEFPCPRQVASTETGSKPLPFAPSALPTGEDQLEVVVGDPLQEPGHFASQTVTVEVDNAAPEVTLAGPLTEQATKGTRLAEYPLTIKATDGNPQNPQSGVARVEVKVDGKKVSMPSESAWAPSCKTRNCPFTGSWTMKTAGYAAGTHEVEVLATDAVGNVSSTTLEVETGQGPPQTSFTTAHPTFENHEIQSVGFKATREGATVSGATFKCSLDVTGDVPKTPCSSPFKLPGHLADGWHTFVVAATANGVADPTPARWRFNTGAYPAAPPNEKLVYPEVGKKTASYYTLEAEWGANPEGKAGQGVSGVTFEVELPVAKPGIATFQTVPSECVIDGQGRQVSWPVPARSNPGHNPPLYLKVRGCKVFEAAGYPEKEVLFRAVFDGGEKVAGVSSPNATEFIYRRNATRVPTDAVEAVGPVSLDLLTGAFTLSHTDVSIPVPGYEANLEFTRVYNSSEDPSTPGYSEVLGGSWQPSNPLEAESQAQAWSGVQERVIPRKDAVYGEECWNEEGETVACAYGAPCAEFCERWLEEEEQPEEKWIELLDNEGAAVTFEIAADGSLVSPDYAKELKLTRENGNFVLAYPNGTHTVFVGQGGGTYIPKYISYQATPGSMRMVYTSNGVGLGMRLVREIAPSPVSCGDFGSIETAGCRTLEFRYRSGEWGYRLESIAYYGPSGQTSEGVLVAAYSYSESRSAGRPENILTYESDPRLPGSGEVYAYAEYPHRDLLTTIVPPGGYAWFLGYESGTDTDPSRLKSVTRGGAQTTISYGVPLKGAGAPYYMAPEGIARWGQTDIPVDATAIFPPNHVPSQSPPSDYAGAKIDYMDPEGHLVNAASSSPPGVTGSSIATTETDMKGNVVRELSPANRLLSLAASDPAARSRELDTHSIYNATGTALLESWGPLHEVRLQSGEIVQARLHTTTSYDEGAPPPPPGSPPAYLPTRETVAAAVAGREGDFEPRVTETHYNWTLRMPTETVIDPGGLDIRSVTVYNSAGQVIETRQPSGADGGTAGDTRYSYYEPTSTSEPGCNGGRQLADLLCFAVAVKQTSGEGRPELVSKWFNNYNNLDESTGLVEFNESKNLLGVVDGKAESLRTTSKSYDAAGRPTKTVTKGGGATVPASETLYSPTQLLPVKQQFVCEKECTGFDNQSTTVTYNNLSQVTEYEDADGNKTKMTYDAYGRPATITDARGTETMHYDEASGLLTSMEVSGVGTFTAAYDADGNMISRGLPNGITAKTTYNAADEPIKLTYTKTSSCGESCTWYEESLERSVEGKILTANSSLANHRYSYDKDGRLTEAQETPTGGQCTSRAYTFDADSNRLTKATRPGVGGACATSGGTIQRYEYDEADRLMGNGTTYDAWGRITSLPAGYAGGQTLTTSYFSNDMVATQSQNGVTNSYQLDATGRQRQREQAGGVAGTEVFHYDSAADGLSWTSLGATWSRNVPGIGGELAAVQESSGTTTFKLSDLHGDVVASASSSPTAKKLLATARFSEFGEPIEGNPVRFGWLGGKARRSELSSGVIQMGARSYIPQLGRFLTPDPVRGGSANAYDYSNQDPVNGSDLSGDRPKRKQRAFGSGSVKRMKAAARAVNREHHRTVRRVERRLTSMRLPSLPSTVFATPSPQSETRAATGLVEAVSSALSRQTENQIQELSADVYSYFHLEPNEKLQDEAACGKAIVEGWASAGPDRVEGIFLGVVNCLAGSIFG